MPPRPRRAFTFKDHAYVTFVGLGGVALIALSAWQLLLVATGHTPARVTRSEADLAYFVLRDVVGIAGGLLAIA